MAAPNVPPPLDADPLMNETDAIGTDAIGTDAIDVDDVDSGYSSSNTSSYASSLATEVTKGIFENGRRYHSYGSGQYAFPNDEAEAERLDMQHAMHTLLLNYKPFFAPIDPNPKKILDLGTGTGIWAIEVADKYPQAQVIGTDISAIQPTWVPPNCQFEIDDAEQTWQFDKNSFDFIHNRNFVCAIRDWPKLIKQSFDHVKPGGWVEWQEKHPKFYSDDGSLKPNSGISEWSDTFFQAGEKFGTNPTSPRFLKGWMEDAGFVDVEEHILKLPCGTWPKDARLKKIGLFEMINITEGLDALSLMLFTRALGMSREETEVFLIEVRNAAKDKNIHSYYQFFVVFGRKPPTKEKAEWTP